MEELLRYECILSAQANAPLCFAKAYYRKCFAALRESPWRLQPQLSALIEQNPFLQQGQALGIDTCEDLKAAYNEMALFGPVCSVLRVFHACKLEPVRGFERLKGFSANLR